MAAAHRQGKFVIIRSLRGYVFLLVNDQRRGPGSQFPFASLLKMALAIALELLCSVFIYKNDIK